MDTIPAKRFLIVQPVGVLGASIDASHYRIDHDFWSTLGPSLPELVASDEEAQRLANDIEAKGDDEGWKFHLGLFGDDDAACIKELVAFLRGGGFVIMDVLATERVS